ncbi:DUF4062 domain-containing protein [Tenacibaculum finnmarkense]|uniref:DUF4062 domain-containing protein n=1 Tax=Tenacibaculum finnmarkense TaxID=2781243 RepID=UPI00211232FD|nr:DUF4062 domain-containing protein [Tenacibaculum finnmarkense]MCG8808883.1 DUF4062 domain-containing protein [Tenacibaculum finnmarkense]MCG8819103.1 DUF4062 domain-containing protein [Tenacibaculum finnmarkense]
MEKRYQVFVSSTYVDLIEERKEIMQALLELECMPAGMELFPAANDTQWEWIKKVIDESDYYIIVIGDRYGSVSEKTGLSYTEMEYRYALEINKPIIAFVHQNPGKLSADRVEKSEENRKKLKEFKTLVQSKLCKFYNNPEDLGSKVSRSIIQLKKQYPAIGWVRANALENYTSTTEYIQLLKENEILKSQIIKFENEKPMMSGRLSSGTDIYKIHYSYSIRKQQKDNPMSWKKVSDGKDYINLTWDEIFTYVALDIINNTSGHSYRVNDPFPNVIKEKEKDKLEEKHPNTRRQDFKTDIDDFNKILLQLRALKFIKKGNGSTWVLTENGEFYLSELKCVKK